MPVSSIPKGNTETMTEVIKNEMKNIDESQVQKFDEITIPSFKVEITNKEVNHNLQLSQGVGGVQMKGGIQTSMIELISGVPSQMSLQGRAGAKALHINEPFIFALNDQELEESQIENSLVIAAEIQKDKWVKL